MAPDPVRIVEQEWLGLRDLIRYAAVSERTLRAWIHSPVDPLPAVRVLGKLLVRRTELDMWLEKHRVRAAAPTFDLDAIVKDTLKRTVRGRQS
jgi:hypothetical protein